MPVLSRARLLPDIIPQLTHTPLSIVDNTVLNFAPTAAIWFFNASPPVEQLLASLRRTLASYPQWCGQLEWAPYNLNGNHTERYHRLMLTYGMPNDPGVEFILATSPRNTPFLASDVDGCFKLDANFFSEFFDTTTPLAMYDGVSYAGLPCMLVQITQLADDGVAIALKLAHPLADAQSLLHFVHDWAAVTRAVKAGSTTPKLAPVFDPSLLDSRAAGDIDASDPDSAIIKLARSLPLHRYDWWGSAKGCPPAFIRTTQIPSELDPKKIDHMGSPLPWDEWDLTAPTSRYFLEFTSAELHAMWEEATTFSRVSHLDALLAHVWKLVIRSRQLEGEHYLDATFGFRNRVQPPLPPSFLGSPLTLAKVTSTVHTDGSIQTLGQLSASIRSSLKAFDPLSSHALLHEMAFEVSPQRVWNAFLGARHTLVTSWLQLGIRDVDFGTGPPASVEAVMPDCDGCVQVMESARHAEGEAKPEHWYDGNVIVALYLESNVIQRFLRDPELRRYR